jgi:hypothetical protein
MKHAADLAKAYRRLLKERGPLTSRNNIQAGGLGGVEMGYWVQICAENPDWCGPGLADQFTSLSSLSLSRPDLKPQQLVISGGAGVGTAGLLLFRALNSGDDPEGPIKSAGDGPTEPYRHILAADGDSEWISTTEDPSIAFGKYQSGGNGVIAISRDSLETDVVYAAKHLDAPDNYLGDMAKDNAWEDKEALVRSIIPGEAIAMHWAPGTQYDDEVKAQIAQLLEEGSDGKGDSVVP